MSAAAIAMMARRKKIIRMFRNAGATNKALAINLDEYNIRPSFVFKKLVRDGIIVNAGNALFYLDEGKEELIDMQRHKAIFIILGIAVILLLIGLLGIYKMNN